MTDAVVVGAGPNGLVAANLLADHGWDVVVLEAEPEPGGAVRSGELLPGHVYDRFSAFYPLAAVSPPMRALQLEQWGLRWRRAPLVLANPFEDGTSAVLSTDPDVTAASVEAFGAGDGERWLRLYARWRSVAEPFVDALLGTPFPPVRAAARLGAATGPRGAARFARFTLLPVRRMCQEEGLHGGAAALLAGSALHSDLSPDAPLSGLFGWLLTMLGQQAGFPVPEGGAGQLTAALVRRLEAKGGRVVCDAPVRSVEIAGGRARGVVTESGERYPARKAVLADVTAPLLYRRLVGENHLPAGVVEDLDRFDLDTATFKVDWVLRGGIPWQDDATGRAGTVHLTPGIPHLARSGLQLAENTIPDRPFLLLGQPTAADPDRSPPGTHVVWAYTRLPQRVAADAGGDLRGVWDRDETERFADRVEAGIEAYAPGFRDLVVTRRVLSPPGLEAQNRNLVGGAINGGTAALHQQLVFRPVPGLGRPTTPVRGLYLASSSAHPGGGVHGACGANAARAALAAERTRRAVFAVGGAATYLLARGARKSR